MNLSKRCATMGNQAGVGSHSWSGKASGCSIESNAKGIRGTRTLDKKAP